MTDSDQGSWRGCGKTQTALRAAHSAVRLDRDPAAREAGLLDASLLLAGDRPRLIDEWQLVPQVWNEFAPPAIYPAAPNGAVTHRDVNPPDPQRLYRTVPSP